MPSRIIHESALTSNTLARMSAGAERLFWRLTVVVDDHGRTHAEPSIVRAKCFPAMVDAVTDGEVAGWLAELGAATDDDEAPVLTYAVRGRRYLQIARWAERQRVRATKSKFPDPTSADTCGQMPADVRGSPQVADICAQPPASVCDPPQSADTCGHPPSNAPVSENGNVNENEIREREREAARGAPARVTAEAVGAVGGVALLPFHCPGDLEPTPGMLAALRAQGCEHPDADARLFVAHYAASERREIDWTETGPRFSRWVARHNQIGCAVRKRPVARSGAAGRQDETREAVRAAIARQKAMGA